MNAEDGWETGNGGGWGGFGRIFEGFGAWAFRMEYSPPLGKRDRLGRYVVGWV